METYELAKPVDKAGADFLPFGWVMPSNLLIITR